MKPRSITALFLLLFVLTGISILAQSAAQTSQIAFKVKFPPYLREDVPKPLRQAVRATMQAWIVDAPASGKFRVTSVRVEADWALLAVSKGDRIVLPDGSTTEIPLEQQVIMVIAVRQGESWSAAFDADEFGSRTLLNQIPEFELSAEARDTLFPTSQTPRLPRNPAAYKMPFLASAGTWTVSDTWHGRDPGDHVDPCQDCNSLDVVSTAALPWTVVLSTSSVIMDVCDYGLYHTWVLAKRIGSDEVMSYLHLANASVPHYVQNGAVLPMGTQLGQIEWKEAFEQDNPCPHGWSGPNFHFALPYKPITVDGQMLDTSTVQNGTELVSHQSPYTGSGQAVTGIVRLASNQLPVPNALVWAVNTSGLIGIPVIADANGLFRFDTLPAPPFTLKATDGTLVGIVDVPSGMYGSGFWAIDLIDGCMVVPRNETGVRCGTQPLPTPLPGSTSAPPATCPTMANTVTFFSDANYTGDCVTLGTGDHPDLGNLCDRVTSIKMTPSNGLMVRVFANLSFQGNLGVFDNDTPDLAVHSWSDTICSAHIQSHGAVCGNAPVELYEHDNFSGQCESVGIGDHASIGLCRQVSSIKMNPSGAYSVRVWENTGFSGNLGQFDSDTASLSPHGWNDKICSVRVEQHFDTTCNPGSEGVIAYNDRAYNPGGGCITLTGDIADLGSWRNAITSLNFVGSYPNTRKVQIYRDTNFANMCGEYINDQFDLMSCTDQARSIRILPFTAPTSIPVPPGTVHAGNVAPQAYMYRGNANLVDGRLDTEWVGGRSTSSVVFSWAVPVTVHRILIFNRIPGPGVDLVGEVAVRFSDGTAWIPPSNIAMSGCVDMTFSPKSDITWIEVVPWEGGSGFAEIEIYATTGNQLSTLSCFDQKNGNPSSVIPGIPQIQATPFPRPVLPQGIDLIVSTVASESSSGESHGPTNPFIIPRGAVYRTIDIRQGAFATTTAWNGGLGGTIDLTAELVCIDGTLTVNGLGYPGGMSIAGSNDGWQGASITGLGWRQIAANAGGGGGASGADSAGGGGGYGSPGFPAVLGPDAPPVPGGGSYGDETISQLYLGSGGGSSGAGSQTWGGNGGSGGGAVRIVAKRICGSGVISANGALGGTGGRLWYNTRGGGGGSGGSIVLHADVIDFTGTITALGGRGGDGIREGSSNHPARGGDGGVGRIRFEYGISLNAVVSQPQASTAQFPVTPTPSATFTSTPTFTPSNTLPASMTPSATKSPTASPTVTATPSNTQTASATPMTSPTHAATAAPSSVPTLTPTTPELGCVELLSQPWHLSGSNGASEAYQSVPPNVLVGRNSARITYDLHGLQALAGDASAITFYQDDWRFISLANYGSNAFDGVQQVTVPLSQFQMNGVYLDLNRPVAMLQTRFWYSGQFVVDVLSIIVCGSNTPTNTPTFTPTFTPTNTSTDTPVSTPATTVTPPDPISISIADATGLEGNTVNSALNFSVSLSRLADQPIQISYITSNGTAIAGQDYLSANGVLTIPAGGQSVGFTIVIVGDVMPEPNESITVVLFNLTNGTLADAEAIGTIIDDDTSADLLIVNGGFEIGLAPWTVKSAPNTPTDDKLICSGFGAASPCFFRFKGAADENSKLTQTLINPPFQANDQLYFSFDYSTKLVSPAIKVKIKAVFADGTCETYLVIPNDVTHLTRTTSSSIPVYQLVGAWLPASVSAQPVAKLQITLLFSGQTGAVMIDNIALKAFRSGTRLELPPQP